MPAVRLSRRRRSSLGLAAFHPAKAGIYGVHPPPRPVTFAPNVTPGTYVEPESESSATTPEPPSPTSTLFPPSETPAPPPTRRRVPPGKRRSMGYIPRPPNAFMLFRADFVRQKHVPGSIETNHGSLSKIIGNCWRSLPLEEKRVWEVKAKHAKAEHKARYPEYRFRPVHNKNKEKKKEKPATTLEDERRCEEVAQLLLEGKKGDELAEAVRNFDRMHDTPPPPVYPPRRSSSVPLPGTYPQIALPVLPFSTQSRPTSPVRSISRMMYGYSQRRASSARPAGMVRSWTMPTPTFLPRDFSPLPEPETSHFEPSFLDAGSAFSTSHAVDSAYNFTGLLNNLPPDAGPLSNLGPLESFGGGFDPSFYHGAAVGPQEVYDQMAWPPLEAPSHTSSAYSGSPASSDNSLPLLHAPQPQHPSTSPTVFTDMFKGFYSGETAQYGGEAPAQFDGEQAPRYDEAPQYDGGAMHMSYEQPLFEAQVHGGLDAPGELGEYAAGGLDSLFQLPSYSSQNTGLVMGYGYDHHDIVHD